MNRYVCPLMICFFVNLSCRNEKLVYPETEIIPVIDNYFGEEISDNYRWLENDMSDKTKDWVERQNNTTFTYLNQIKFRKDLKPHPMPSEGDRDRIVFAHQKNIFGQTVYKFFGIFRPDIDRTNPVRHYFKRESKEINLNKYFEEGQKLNMSTR